MAMKMVYVVESEKNGDRFLVGASWEKDEAIEMAQKAYDKLTDYDKEREEVNVYGYLLRPTKETDPEWAYEDALEENWQGMDAAFFHHIKTAKELKGERQ